MLRALHAFLGTGIPVIGVNFGRVGFLSSIPRDELEQGSRACSPASSSPSSSPTLEVEAGGERLVAVNDAVVTSGELGRMVELEWSIGGEDFGRVPCDGLDLLDAVRLDRLQPLERRAGVDVGARRDGAHVRRSSRPARAAVRRSSRQRPRTSGTGPGRRLRRARRRPPRRRRGLGRRACRSGSASSARSSDAAGGDVRRRYRQSFGISLSAGRRTVSHRTAVHGAAGLPSRCYAACGSRTSSSFARPSSSWRRASTSLSGETGAGKTIFAQAIGLLLGVKGDAGAVGPAATEAYVEAEFDVPDGFFEESGAEALAELRPEDEPGLVLARRVFADGRTRAYAWGRAIAREDLAAASERLIAMSGQFEQRRLARPAYQLDVLDAFVGAEQLERRHQAREPGARWTPRDGTTRRSPAMRRGRRAASRRCASSSSATDGLSRVRRSRCAPSATACATQPTSRKAPPRATAAVAPDDGDGAASLAAAAERALEPADPARAELEGPAAELRDLTVRLSEVGSDLHRFVASLEADPARVRRRSRRGST